MFVSVHFGFSIVFINIQEPPLGRLQSRSAGGGRVAVSSIADNSKPLATVDGFHDLFSVAQRLFKCVPSSHWGSGSVGTMVSFMYNNKNNQNKRRSKIKPM